MFEEPVRFIEDVIRNDRSVLDLLYGNYTFVNPVLAKHYGMPELAGEPGQWVRVDDAGRYGRGGLLPMAVFLTQNAPGLRTSPVKRGYWVVRRVLGETIPPPPPVVPELPHDEAKLDLPLREMLAKHRENPGCAACHARFDSFGLAFEGYGPIGERRSKDLAGRPVDTRRFFPAAARAPDSRACKPTSASIARKTSSTISAANCWPTLWAGRSCSPMNPPLSACKPALAANGYRFTPLVETIVTSPQFLNKRSVVFHGTER